MNAFSSDQPCLARLTGIEQYADGSIILHFRLADGSLRSERFTRWPRMSRAWSNDENKAFHEAVVAAYKTWEGT